MKKIYVCIPENADVTMLRVGDILYINLSALQENDEAHRSLEE